MFTFDRVLLCGKGTIEPPIIFHDHCCGAGRVTIQNHDGNYVWIFNPASIHRLVSLARVRDWEDFKCLWVPEDFRIEGCRVLTGMRSTCTLIEEDALWLEGTDGSHLFVSVRLGSECVRQQVRK